MTGDGLIDAPALKTTDIDIAFAAATNVARGEYDIVFMVLIIANLNDEVDAIKIMNVTRQYLYMDNRTTETVIMKNALYQTPRSEA
nr:hypothetical protein [Tanacetum cinerariifolium]